jgi:hypothetical protein
MQEKFSMYHMQVPFIKDSCPVGHNINYYRKFVGRYCMYIQTLHCTSILYMPYCTGGSTVSILTSYRMDEGVSQCPEHLWRQPAFYWRGTLNSFQESNSVWSAKLTTLFHWVLALGMYGTVQPCIPSRD